MAYGSDNRKSKIENPKSDDLDPIYSYDLNGNRTSMIDPTGLTTYTYDVLNRLTSITNNKSQTTSFTYDALGRRTSMTHANGVVTSYTYDAASQLLALGHQLGATTINSFSYTYDKVGNRKTKTSRDGLHDYTYDVLNRLTQATNPLPSNPLETFNYDSVGNRTNSNQNGSSIFNSANQLSEDANFTYQYDNNGNIIQKTAKAGGAITQYHYDAENRLVRVVSPNNTANYKYDGLGRRVEKEVIGDATSMTKYVYDNEDVLLELNGSNTIVARYTHGPGTDEPLIMEKNNQSFYYHADGLGSIADMTIQSGAVTQRYTYSSFGKIESQLDPNFLQPYTYTSREFDLETGLYYYRARYYDATIGRFLQEDPVDFDGMTNIYSYVGGNPVAWRDPTGLRIIFGNYVLNNPILVNNLQRLNQEIVNLGIRDADFTLRVTGGDRYRDQAGNIRSSTDNQKINNSDPNSAHLIENGARAVDLDITGVTREIFNKALGKTDFDPAGTLYPESYPKEPHTHIRLPNKPQYNYDPKNPPPPVCYL
jgi:RHS repeat-associated protein